MTKTSDDFPEIRAVLDRSALESYARGHVHVGELLIDVADEQGHMAIPAAALAEAYGRAHGDKHTQALLRLLTTLEGITVLSLDAESARAMAGTIPMTGGDIPQAHAVWAAHRHKALYLTTDPDGVETILPFDQIHPIPFHDA